VGADTPSLAARARTAEIDWSLFRSIAGKDDHSPQCVSETFKTAGPRPPMITRR
jgi:hypothetical protein